MLDRSQAFPKLLAKAIGGLAQCPDHLLLAFGLRELAGEAFAGARIERFERDQVRRAHHRDRAGQESLRTEADADLTAKLAGDPGVRGAAHQAEGLPDTG